MKRIRIGTPLISIGAGLAFSLIVTNAYADICQPCATCCPRDAYECWQGGYFGAFFAAGDGRIHTSLKDETTFTQIVSNPPVTSTTIETEQGFGKLRGDTTGSISGLLLGYNFHPRCSRFVFGAQLEGTVFSDISLKSTGDRHFNTTRIADTSTTTVTGLGTFDHLDELRSIASLLGRAGFLISPCTLIYGLVAATEGNFVIPLSEEQFGSKRNQWELGYSAGAGLEYKFNKNWSARAEYRFVHFDIDRDSGSVNSQTNVIGDVVVTTDRRFNQHTSNDVDYNLGTISIVYRFDPCCCW